MSYDPRTVQEAAMTRQEKSMMLKSYLPLPPKTLCPSSFQITLFPLLPKHCLSPPPTCRSCCWPLSCCLQELQLYIKLAHRGGRDLETRWQMERQLYPAWKVQLGLACKGVWQRALVRACGSVHANVLRRDVATKLLPHARAAPSKLISAKFTSAKLSFAAC